MYIWRVDALKSELRAGPIPAGRLLPYLLGLGVLLAIVAQIPLFLPLPDPNRWDVVNLGGTVLATLLGLFATYRSNGGPEGSDFAGCLLALWWVVGWRLLPVFVLLMLAALIVTPEQFAVPDAATTARLVIVSLAYQGLFYWRLSKHLRDIAMPRPDSPQSASAPVAA